MIIGVRICLKKLRWYLVGPIQFVEDYYSWRREMIQFLESLGHEGLMPWGEMYHSTWIKGEYKTWAKTMKEDEYLARVRKHMRKNVIHFDLNQLLDSDGLICSFPKDVITAGSHGEITLAYYLKKWESNGKKKWFDGKKIFVITDIPTNELPYWLIGCSDRIFTNKGDFEKYFKESFNRKRKKND